MTGHKWAEPKQPYLANVTFDTPVKVKLMDGTILPGKIVFVSLN